MDLMWVCCSNRETSHFDPLEEGTSKKVGLRLWGSLPLKIHTNVVKIVVIDEVSYVLPFSLSIFDQLREHRCVLSP